MMFYDRTDTELYNLAWEYAVKEEAKAGSSSDGWSHEYHRRLSYLLAELAKRLVRG